MQKRAQKERNFANRSYLSIGEVSAYLNYPVEEIHSLAKSGSLASFKAASGQYRFDLSDVEKLPRRQKENDAGQFGAKLEVRDTCQQLMHGDSSDMRQIEDESVNLAITSPPYFNAKMYSEEKGDLGNVHDLEDWFEKIGSVWREVYRVLQPGRKFFLNIMNLPVKEGSTFRTLNLVGKSIDLCEKIGFIFKRDIVWEKTNAPRGHFGSYPYPGGILINNMHEFILELDKPAKSAGSKYAHISAEDKEASKLDKDFWLSLKNSDVWKMKPEASGGNRKHMAPFPVELPERLIKAYSYVGEQVLDPFVGSGTTCVAAALNGRNGIGYDLNKSFLRMAQQRLADLGVSRQQTSGP